MAVIELNLIILHRALVIFHRTLVLQDQLFLVSDDLLCNGVSSQCGAVASEVQLRLREHILVAFQNSLRLQKRRAVWTWIDVNKRVTLLYNLTLFKGHANNLPIYLTGDR